jgi:hypothetical protein
VPYPRSSCRRFIAPVAPRITIKTGFWSSKVTKSHQKSSGPACMHPLPLDSRPSMGRSGQPLAVISTRKSTRKCIQPGFESDSTESSEGPIQFLCNPLCRTRFFLAQRQACCPDSQRVDFLGLAVVSATSKERLIQERKRCG